jgi:hypothetical protein
MDAPSGFGPQNFVSDARLLPYQINFENASTATAPAQRVDIADQLDPNLDWTSLELSAVGFGDTYIAVPAGLQHYDASVSVTENGQTFEVEISLNLNPATGVLTASFQSIDPKTDLPPVSLLTGFLPPEDGSGRGSGFVSFTVNSIAGLTTGTQIRNVADIAFDRSPYISTDQVDDEDASQGIDPNKQALITIDSVAPTSSVAPLPAVSTTAAILVSWAGADDTGGSGIRSYDIYVSDNGGPLLSWLVNTTQTSGTYQGVNGHNYGFASVAIDNAGNQLPPPTSPDAKTTVNVILPTSTVAPLRPFSPGVFTVDWSGSSSDGQAITGYDVYVSDNGAPYSKWLTATASNSAQFTGADGHTYAFFSVATNALGNVQTLPSSAQATTTVDAQSPTSSVQHLPATETAASFAISWSGSDKAGGSGVSGYTIYVSDNGGPFAKYLTNTTQTSATFTGAGGHTYGFYSLATDLAGNVQPAPGTAQTTTTIVLNNGIINGIVFRDLNLDGKQNGSEPGAANQTVFLDLNNNGVLDSNEPTATTTSTGAYSFTNLVPGTYVVRQVLLGGVILSSPSQGDYSLTVATGANLSSNNFADVFTSITVPLTLSPSTPFPAQGAANADYVVALYRAVLNRNGDSSGVSFWTAQLNDGSSTRIQVAQGIRNSPEHFGQEIDAFYQTLLGRKADAQGRASWVTQLENGAREEQIAFNFLNSHEYLSKGDKYFVDAMYLSLLGRSFDQAGEASWFDALGDDASGNPTHTATLTHAQVITDFLYSSESLSRLVEGYYEVFLQRQADPGGMNNWVSQLQGGLPFLTIGQEFIASDEFYNKAAANM